jgi:hypothetical protein
MKIYQVLGDELGSTWSSNDPWTVAFYLKKADADYRAEIETEKLSKPERSLCKFIVKEINVIE